MMKTMEKQISHTPGPWDRGRTLLTQQTRRWSKEQIEENDARERFLIFSGFTARDEGRSRIPIAEVRRDNYESEANARLIAAAPELLESLGVMTALCKIKYGNLDKDVYAEILKAEAAYSKATGGAR